MKKLILTSAIAALTISAAHAKPEFYGKVFATADYINSEADVKNRLAADERVEALNDYDENAVEINSHSSRLGLKGSEAVTDNTDIIYKLEYGFSVDGDKSDFKSRDTYIGVANKKLGEFRVGRNSTVLDNVNNVTLTEGYWDNLGDGKLKSEKELRALNMLDDSRQNSSIVWIAPKYKELPLELALQYAADENFEDSNNGFGASLMFDQGTGFTAGLAYSKDMDINGDINLLNTTDPKKKNKVDYGGDVIRATATADLSKYIAAPITMGVMYQQADYDFTGSTKEKGLVVSGEMGLTNFAKPASVYMQYNKTDNLNGFNDSNSDQIVLGGKYKFKKNIIGHAYVGQNSADYVAVGKVNKINDKGNEKLERYDIIRSDINVFAVGGGLEYKF
ncbi:porin [Psychrobacter sp. GP33]|uniref:porin n=1 Tax=Psychrobacter sp. GP33 TaxID=2758709 RepID=UPI0015FD2D34|nr:porin [Psychrobacter sp. GP33]